LRPVIAEGPSSVEWVRRLASTLAIALVLGSCAAESADSPSTGGEPTTSTVVTTVPPETTTTAAVTTTSGMTTTTEPPVYVEIRGGEVTGPDRFEFGLGEMVSITVVADTPYELHVHGYDLLFDVEPETPLIIEFTADVPGIFEVETHPGHLVAFEIEVGS
jgi:hypothetical protein